MGNGIVVAGNLHLLPVILGEDVVLASVFAERYVSGSPCGVHSESESSCGANWACSSRIAVWYSVGCRLISSALTGWAAFTRATRAAAESSCSSHRPITDDCNPLAAK